MPRLESDEITNELQEAKNGPTFVALVLETVGEQAHFHRNRAAVLETLRLTCLKRILPI